MTYFLSFAESPLWHFNQHIIWTDIICQLVWSVPCQLSTQHVTAIGSSSQRLMPFFLNLCCLVIRRSIWHTVRVSICHIVWRSIWRILPFYLVQFRKVQQFWLSIWLQFSYYIWLASWHKFWHSSWRCSCFPSGSWSLALSSQRKTKQVRSSTAQPNRDVR